MKPFRIVTVGTSLGGFEALALVLARLPKSFPVPVAVVQHRSIEDSDAIVALLARETELRVEEVEDKTEFKPGHVYVGPPNYHLLVEQDHFELSMDPPVMFARPSIDVLFESAAESCHDGVVGVLLTGMSRDGAAGAARIKECGGIVIVQDPNSAEGSVMPAAAVSSVAVDKVLPLTEIAPYLVELCAN
ncbi:MAG: chemotaxis protein CheB [Acidobacteria bacterium]|nr:chemotaxis protein CheB [Acidobacteriota bacterium]